MKRSEVESVSVQRRVSRFLLRYRVTPHTSTQLSPAELMMGRELRTRLDLLRPDVAKQVQKSQAMQRKHHDETCQIRNFTVGDEVFVRNFSSGPRWIPGIIVEITGPVSVKVRLNNANCSVVRRHFDQVREKWSENVLGMPALQGIKPNYDGSMLDLKEHSVPTSMDLNCKEQLEKPSEDILELVTTVDSCSEFGSGQTEYRENHTDS